MPTIEDRFRGCLVGGATGDALGAPIEFFSEADINERYGDEGIRELEPSYGVVGAITDDTQMTLFTAEGCIRYGEIAVDVDVTRLTQSIRFAYQRWFDTQQSAHQGSESESAKGGYLARLPAMRNRRGPGNTCLTALANGRPVISSKGCGGVMRVAPVGLFLAGQADRRTVFDAGCRSAEITHGHPSGYLAAGVLAALIAGVIEGQALSDSLEVALDILQEHEEHHEVLSKVTAAIRLSRDGVDRTQVFATLGEGWIAEEALAIGVYSCMAWQSLEEAVVYSVNHGGDSDSTGSITGQIIGAVMGFESIPDRWIQRLELIDTIEKIALDLNRSRTGVDRKELDRVYCSMAE